MEAYLKIFGGHLFVLNFFVQNWIFQTVFHFSCEENEIVLIHTEHKEIPLCSVVIQYVSKCKITITAQKNSIQTKNCMEIVSKKVYHTWNFDVKKNQENVTFLSVFLKEM